MLKSNISTQKIPYLVDGYTIHALNILIHKESGIQQIVSIPSQIGCNNSCSFCISKDQPLVRNLKQNEIQEIINLIPITGTHTEISFTGEGEPLHNLKNINPVLKNNRFDSVKFAFSGLGSHLLQDIDTDIPITIQFSLHHANQIKRNKMIPKSDNLETIRTNLLKYQFKFEKININYVVAPGENNSEEDFKLLEEFTIGTQWTILFNPLLTENEMVEPSSQNLNLHQVKYYKKIAKSITDNHIYPYLTYSNN